MIEILSILYAKSFWLLVLIGAFTWIYFYSTRNYDYWKKRNISGPPRFPFIGNYFSLSKPMPHLQLDYVRKYGKYFGAFRFSEPILYIADPAVIKRILVKDFHLFQNRPNKTTDRLSALNLVNIKGEPWKRIRSIVTPIFTSSKLRKMEPLMRQCTKSVLDSFDRCAANQTESSLFVYNTMGNFTMDVIAKCAFATDTNANIDPNNAFVRNARELFTFNVKRLLIFFILPSVLVRFFRSLKLPFFRLASGTFFVDLAKHLITERRENKSANGYASGAAAYEDMLQLMSNAELEDSNHSAKVDQEDLLEAHHVNVGNEEIENEKVQLKVTSGNKKLSEDEMIAQSVVFLLAGYETTASTLTFCIYELAVNPLVQERLFEEIQQAKEKDPTLGYQTVQNLPYLDAVISETLRRHPPVMDLGRECTADEVYIPEMNHTLKRGDIVILPVYAIHHNEQYYSEPERFNPDRFLPENRSNIKPYTYLPFGGGPRNCIGMRFALTEIKLGLANILDRFVITRTDKTPEPLKIAVSFRLMKTEPIYVGIKRRNL